ncbi:MAG: hypothetical protein V4819_21745 [Verrucomicrobiota bacterium]
MSLFQRIFGSPKSFPPPLPQRAAPKVGNIYITRGNRNVAADEVFLAWSSDCLPRMEAATKFSTNPVDRHFLLLNLVGHTYKRRKDRNMRQLCINYGILHTQEFPRLKPHLVKEMDGVLPRVSTYQYLATIFTEDNRFSDAISICQQAMNLGLEDGTSSGFEGRIARIQKKV